MQTYRVIRCFEEIFPEFWKQRSHYRIRAYNNVIVYLDNGMVCDFKVTNYRSDKEFSYTLTGKYKGVDHEN